jgi:hypothetical protein
MKKTKTKRGLKKGDIVIYSKSEEGKAFVHANCEEAIQVNENRLSLECTMYLVFFDDTSLESESVTLYSKF